MPLEAGADHGALHGSHTHHAIAISCNSNFRYLCLATHWGGLRGHFADLRTKSEGFTGVVRPIAPILGCPLILFAFLSAVGCRCI